MSEDNNRPPSINLEELERQLREALSRRAAPHEPGEQTTNQEDPLSMLARLVEHEGGARQQPFPPAQQPAMPQMDPAAAAMGFPPQPVHSQPAHPQSVDVHPVPQWQSYEEQTAPHYAAGQPEPTAYPSGSYEPSDHLVFDPGHYAAAPYSPPHSPPPVPADYVSVPASESYPAPSQPPAYAGGYDQAPVSQPEPAAVSHPETVDYHASVPPLSGMAASAPAAEPIGQGMPLPDFLTESHLAQAHLTQDHVPSSRSFDPTGFDTSLIEPRRPEPAVPASGYDHWPLSASTQTTVPDFLVPPQDQFIQSQPIAQTAPPASAGGEAHDPLFAVPQQSAQPASQSAEKAAADLSLIYGSTFPGREKHDSQWSDAQAKGVGLSFSEAEANLGSEPRPAEQPVKKRGSGLMILMGLIVVMAGGFGVTYYLRNEGVRLPSGAPPVIVADKNPVKVVPANPGGTEVPNQGAAIYQPTKTEDAKAAKVVSTDEKPVDISLAPRPPGSTLIGEPKKIRTVTVRPDGSVIDESTAAPGASVPNSAAMPRATPSMVTVSPPVAPQSAVPAPATPSQPAPQAAQPAAQPSLPAAPQAPAAPVAAPAQPLPASTNANVVKTLPPSRPQQAEAQPPANSPRATPSKEVEPPAGGDYGVQFSAPGSEAEARNAIDGLKRSYPKIVEGLSLTAQKAENNGRTIFRVRAVGLSRDEAISVCEKIKASGGPCFVARN